MYIIRISEELILYISFHLHICVWYMCVSYGELDWYKTGEISTIDYIALWTIYIFGLLLHPHTLLTVPFFTSYTLGIFFLRPKYWRYPNWPKPRVPDGILLQTKVLRMRNWGYFNKIINQPSVTVTNIQIKIEITKYMWILTYRLLIF